MALRVGNIVKRINSDNPNFRKGQYGVIEKIIGSDYVTIKGNDNENHVENLELIHDVVVGDKIRRIESDWNKVIHGHIYTIRDIKVGKIDGIVEIKIEEDRDENRWYSFRKFEKVEEIKTKELTPEDIEEKKKQLIEELKTFDNRQIEEEIRDLKDSIVRVQSRIDRDARNMNENYRDLKKYMVDLKVKESETEEKDFTHDINALFNHPSVKDVVLHKPSKLIKVITNHIDMYDEDGNKYAGNKYRLDFSYKYMEVRIFGLDNDFCNKSYWTDHDPHPHVDGDGGYPCLGNAGSMLCQSMNEMELYASFIIIYNFLQQVNTEDVAGKYVENWDCIDEEGNIIDNPKVRPVYTCSICNYETHNEDYIYTCEDCGYEVCCDHREYIEDYGYVCSECLEKDWQRCESCGEYERKESMIEIDGYMYCKPCVEEEFFKCSECGEYVRCGSEYEVDGNILCGDCYDEITVECTHCDERIMKKDATEHLGEFYCDECYEEMMEIDEEKDMEEATNEC